MNSGGARTRKRYGRNVRYLPSGFPLRSMRAPGKSMPKESDEGKTRSCFSCSHSMVASIPESDGLDCCKPTSVFVESLETLSVLIEPCKLLPLRIGAIL